MEISYLHIRGNYALIRGFIVVSLWLLLGHNTSAQSWNLVWREDFGVAEDTVIKDFPDPTMTVPNHHFYTWRKVQTGWDSANNCATYEYVEGDDCGEIQDGFTASPTARGGRTTDLHDATNQQDTSPADATIPATRMAPC